MARRKDDVVVGADFHDLHDLRQDLAVLDNGNPLSSAAFDGVRIYGGHRRHPDAFAAVPCRFHGHLRRVDVDFVADGVIHAEAAEHFKIRQGLADEIGPVVAAPFVRLVHDGPIAQLLGLAGEIKLIDAPLPHVRRGMDVDVADSLQ